MLGLSRLSGAFNDAFFNGYDTPKQRYKINVDEVSVFFSCHEGNTMKMPLFRRHRDTKTGKHAPSMDRCFNKEELRFILIAITYPNIQEPADNYTVGQLKAAILQWAALKVD